ncbi:MAM domain-containing glycosylphosphatidylinositol anchor protein 1 [Aphelenchoides fujianensis]|nr:MAM domain-containing glycosylphosphatidylinositol anchor protein 1 [Aphelenchoides fujianensis]
MSQSRVPDPPENLRAKAESKSITLWWSPPASANAVIVRGYTLAYGVETPSHRLILEGVNTNAFTVDGLKPNTSYIFALTAYNEAPGEDSERVLLSASTLPVDNGENGVKPPVGLRAEVLSPSEARVYWSDPNGQDGEKQADSIVLQQRFFNLELWNSEVTKAERRKVTTEGTKAALKNLEPGQLFAFRVRVVQRGGAESPWSEVQYFKTPNEGGKSGWSSKRAKVEKCDFESPGQCDYVSDTSGLYEWTRVPTENGPPGGGSQSFGRLLSPVFNLRKSPAICISLHYFVSAGSKGSFKLSLLFEGNTLEQAVPLFSAQLQDLTQAHWNKLTVEAKARPNRGFQLLLEGARTKNKHAGFKINVDNVTVIANTCPETRRHFGTVVGE